MLNGYEIILILALALVFFGAKRLPELARGLGQGLREFKRATREVTDQLHEAAYEADRPLPPPDVPSHPYESESAFAPDQALPPADSESASVSADSDKP